MAIFFTQIDFAQPIPVTIDVDPSSHISAGLTCMPFFIFLLCPENDTLTVQSAPSQTKTYGAYSKSLKLTWINKNKDNAII
jgi:hypothetical protein